MSILTNNNSMREMLTNPMLWKFVDVEVKGQTSVIYICKTTLAKHNIRFVRGTLRFSFDGDEATFVLHCKFLNKTYTDKCDKGLIMHCVTDIVRGLLSQQEADYYGQTPEHWLEGNLNPDEPEVHG